MQRTSPRAVLLAATAACLLLFGASSAATAADPPIGQKLLAVLGGGAADANIVVFGDSTGDEITEWVFALGERFAARYPSYRINYYLWNDRQRQWPASPAVLQEGDPGGHALNIWNMSVSGTYENYPLQFVNGPIISRHPDLVLVNYGHNDGAETVRFRWGVETLVQTILAEAPATDIALIAQNAQVGNTYQQAREAELRLLAGQDHLGFIDVLQTFAATGNPAAYLESDGIHPTAGGQQFWATIVFDSLGPPGDGPRPAENTSPPVNLISFGDFAVFSKGKPVGWTLKNVKPAVDFASAEAPHRFAVRFTQIDPSVPAYLYQPFDIKQVRGRWVTVAVRIYLPSPDASTSVGMVGATDNRTDISASVQRGDGPRDVYHWQIVTRQIDPKATTAGVIVYVDSDAGAPSTVIVQQVYAVLGTDVPLRPGERPRRTRPYGD
jgi:lysophospholipase L1-like esterase